MNSRQQKSAPDIQKTIREHLEKAKAGRLPTMPDSNWPRAENQEMRDKGSVTIEGCTIELFYVDRELWPGVPKGRLIQYYHEIAPHILPYLKDRPLSLHLKIGKPMGDGFYLKDMEGRQPTCGKLFTDKRRQPKAGKRPKIDYVICIVATSGQPH